MEVRFKRDTVEPEELMALVERVRLVGHRNVQANFFSVPAIYRITMLYMYRCAGSKPCRAWSQNRRRRRLAVQVWGLRLV